MTQMLVYKKGILHLFTFLFTTAASNGFVTGGSSDLCIYMNQLNCTNHASGTLCGTNKVTYANHCEYSKAVCHDPTLSVLKAGPCRHEKEEQEIVLGIACESLLHMDCSTFRSSITYCGTNDLPESLKMVVPNEKEEDIEKVLIAGLIQRQRSSTSTTSKGKSKGQVLSGLMGMLAAVLILAIVTVISTVVYETNKNKGSADGTTECGEYSYPGVNMSDLSPRIHSEEKTCNFEGNCWKGEDCYRCFENTRWNVGTINAVPVCCPDCELGNLTLTANSCNCRSRQADRSLR